MIDPIILAALLSSAVLILTLSRRLKAWRTQHPGFVEVVVSLVATFVGVLLAFAYENMRERENEKRDAARFLEVAVIDLDHVGRHLSLFYAGRRKDPNPLTRTTGEYLTRNPLPLPSIAHHCLEMDVVLSNISSQGYANLSEGLRRISSLHGHMHSQGVPDNYVIQSAEHYGGWLYYIKQVLRTEAAHLRGELDTDQLAKAHRRALVVALGFRRRDVKQVLPAVGENYFDTHDWESDFTFD